MFGFRQKRSWLIFLGINVLTQSVINIIIYNGIWLGTLGLILFMPSIEFGVILAETIVIATTVKEQTIARRIICPIVANIISFVLSFVIADVFPM